MRLEHLDHALIHQLQQRRGVRWQKDELDVLMQVLQHMGVGKSIVEDHQDMEGEALRCAILFQLVHQLRLAVALENVASHPTSGIGKPMDRQAGLVITLEHTWVLGMVDRDRLELAVSCQVSPQQEGETVFICLKAWGKLLLPCDVHEVRHFIPLQAHFIHVKNLLGLVPSPPSSMMVLRLSG